MVLWSSCKILQHKHKSHNIKFSDTDLVLKFRNTTVRLCGSFIPCALWVSACPGVGLVGTCTCAPQLFTTAWQCQVQAAGLRGPAPMAVTRILLEPLQHQHLHTAQDQPCWSGKIFCCKTKFDWIKHSAFSWMTIAEVFFEGFSEKDTDVPGHPALPLGHYQGCLFQLP